MSRRRFFADTLAGDRALVTGAGAEHLSRVLRAAPGTRYEIAFAGRAYLGCITNVSTSRVEFQVERELEVPSNASLELAIAVFNFGRLEWTLEKATELGATAIHLVETRRTEARWVEGAPGRMKRWAAIVRGAAEQSRRADEPRLEAAAGLANFLAQPFKGRRVVLSEEPGGAPLDASDEATRLLVGPEGGWAAEELAQIAAAGYAAVWLGPRILRCETAALAGLARAR